MKKIIIAAVAKNGVIGRSSGEMPWYSKEEFAHFKKTTQGFVVIMGRKTFESLGKRLSKRLNIVLTRNKEIQNKNVVAFPSLTAAYEFCESKKYEKVFVIGGGDVFKKAITEAEEMIISHMKFEAVGEISFPKINLKKWEIISRDDRKDFEIITYIRKISA
jgi:dihydrofolate reductase